MSLEARDITVRVGRKRLVDSVSLRVTPGEVVAVIGPNGAGKSTLLRALSGDVSPDAGEVLMGGKPLQEWSLRDRARVRGILSQSNTLNFAFSVLQVVLMGRAPHSRGRESRYDYEVVHAALQAAEVQHLEDRIYTTLSGGEKQRVQLARIMAQIWEPINEGPRYLMMDEPTNNLDMSHQHGILGHARDLAAQDVAVMIILHDLNLAAQYADRILLLHEGREVITGRPRTVLTTENIMAAFGMPVIIAPHPHLDCPLVVPVATRSEVKQSPV
jgi:iron complex transport system ATP-binding protein